MRIEEYFRIIENIIEFCPVVYLSNVKYEKRGTHEGFIRGRLHFVDNSILYWREFIDVEITEDRLMYTYQYMDSSTEFLFRFDNTGHHKKLGLRTFPHHKHERNEDNIIPASAPDLSLVLQEIESIVKLP